MVSGSQPALLASMKRTAATIAQALLPAALLAALAICAITQSAPEAGWVGSPSQVASDQTPHNAPTFADVRDDFPGCVSIERWNWTHADLAADDLARIPPMTVAVHLDGTAHLEPTKVAWRKAEASESSYWIVGACG